MFPKEGLKKAVPKILTVICDNLEMVRDRMSVLITNRKSHMSF